MGPDDPIDEIDPDIAKRGIGKGRPPEAPDRFSEAFHEYHDREGREGHLGDWIGYVVLSAMITIVALLTAAIVAITKRGG